jgi:hypothetical protein
MVVGEDEVAYKALLEFVAANRLGTHLRLVIVNPLDKRLPRLPVLMTATCNTFTHSNYIKPQWAEMRRLYDKHLEPVIGPLVGHGSDGDSRRRMAMLLESALGQPGPLPFTLDTHGFVYGAYSRAPGSVPIAVLDQDWIHCGKKIVNAFANSSRVLRLGASRSASLQLLRRFVENGNRDDHGIKSSDLDRTGFAAMDWPSAARLISSKALTAMKSRARTAPYLQGSIRLLGIVRDFVSIFADTGMPYLERVRRVGRVTTYLRLWRGWVKHTERESLDINYITREGMQDAILACHMVVLISMIARDHTPDADVTFDLLGTDMYEDFFSSLGSVNTNKRTYSIMEAIETARSKMRLRWLEALGYVIFPKEDRRKKAPWDNEDFEDWDKRIWPTDPAIKQEWERGCQDGKKMAVEDGMKPAGRRLQEWWTNPESNDPKLPKAQRRRPRRRGYHRGQQRSGR